MGKFNKYLEAAKTRHSFLADIMVSRASKGKCMFCDEPATWKNEDGEKFCGKCKAHAIGKNWTKIEK